MCMIWGEQWGFELGMDLNDAGISHEDLMASLGFSQRLGPFNFEGIHVISRDGHVSLETLSCV